MTDSAAERLAHMTGRYIQQHAEGPKEDEALGRIAGALKSWREQMGDRSVGIMSRHDGSDLRGDELRVPKLPRERRSRATQNDPLTHVAPSELADHAIGTFHNLMRAFDSMVVNDERTEMRLHLSAEFVLIRALIEAATTALWLLGPDDSDERILRALRLRYDELLHSRNLTTVYNKYADIADDDAAQAQEAFISGQIDDLAEVARSADIAWAEVKKRPGPKLIALEAGEFAPELGPAMTFWYWSTASSIAHAEPANLYLLADLRFIGVDVRDQPVAHAEPSGAAIWKHLEASILLIRHAHRFWNLRSRAS